MSNKNGFTLLEVLIAMSILGISLLALLTTHNQNLNMMYQLSNISRATALAKGVMEKTELDNFADIKDDAGGFEEADASDMKWVKTVTETGIGDLKEITIKEINVKVFWGDEDDNRAVSLSTLIAER